jgi:hypothetical protein
MMPSIIPGMGLIARVPTILVPLTNAPIYNTQKNISEDKSALEVSKQTVPKSQEQTGFGKVDEISDGDVDDVDMESSKFVNEDILKAFQSPVIRTAVINFSPSAATSSKKLNTVSEETKMKKKGPSVNKLKFV